MKADLLKADRINKFISNPGSPLKEVFHGKITDSGEIVLVSDGIINTDEIIASYEPETDIENIITRVMAGELDLLEQKKGVYFDSIGLPKTYAEVLQSVIDGQNMFNALPADIREKFGNDFNVWFAQMDEPDFLVKTGFVKSAEPVVSEVKESSNES